MKTEKYYLVLAVVIGILCVPALGEVELPRAVERGLIVQPNQALAGIDQLYVFIIPPDKEPSKDGLVWEELQLKVEHKLKEAGIRYVKPRSLPTPRLTVYIDMLKLLDSQKYVFRVQTALARTVTLPKQRNLHLLVDVWKTGPTMQEVSVKDMPGMVTNAVLQQIEVFVHAYFTANRPAKLSDAKISETVSPATKRQRHKPVAKPTAAKYKYVASKNSKVFHKPHCSGALRIKPKNLIGYSSRAEALKAGKRPCKICKP